MSIITRDGQQFTFIYMMMYISWLRPQHYLLMCYFYLSLSRISHISNIHCHQEWLLNIINDYWHAYCHTLSICPRARVFYLINSTILRACCVQIRNFFHIIFYLITIKCRMRRVCFSSSRPRKSRPFKKWMRAFVFVPCFCIYK